MADFEQLFLAVLGLPTVPGIVPVDILTIPQPLQGVVVGLVRNKSMSVAKLAELIDVTPDEALRLADTLISKGYLVVTDSDSNSDSTSDSDTGDEVRFRIHYARVPKHHFPSDL